MSRFSKKHTYKLINHTKYAIDNKAYSLIMRIPKINAEIIALIEQGVIKEILGTKETLLLYDQYQIKKTELEIPPKYWSDYCNNKYSKKPKNIIMITGTNGKTSSCIYIAQILTRLNIPNIAITTVGIYINGKESKRTDNSTPDAKILHKELSDFTEKYSKNSFAIIETTSIAIESYRVHNIHGKIGLFTNFTADHLDYHHTLEQYFQEKMKLGNQVQKFLVHDSIKQYKYPQYGKEFVSKTYKKDTKTSLFIYKIDKKTYEIETKLAGKGNSENILTAILALKKFFPIEEIMPHISHLTPANGRCNIYGKFILDFAHTKDAVQQIIDIAKEQSDGKIAVIIGFGGDDIIRRVEIPQILKDQVDIIIFTTDNPRNEEPMEIAMTAQKHCPNAIIELNREKAIELADNMTSDNDLILILGKGHENYMEYKNHQKLPYSDQEIILKTLKNTQK